MPQEFLFRFVWRFSFVRDVLCLFQNKRINLGNELRTVTSVDKMPPMSRSGAVVAGSLRLLARPVPGRHGLGGTRPPPSDFIRSGPILTARFTGRLSGGVRLRFAEGRPEEESGGLDPGALPAVLARSTGAASESHWWRLVGEARRFQW